MKLFMMLFLFPVFAFAGTANLKDGIILDSYDPVSYFKPNGPQKGKPEFKYVQGEITYLFANEANLKEFKADNKKYTPAYEGWCATAMAAGYKYEIDPKNFKITDNRLFLFYKGWKGDAKEKWLKDEMNLLKQADANWPKVRDKKE